MYTFTRRVLALEAEVNRTNAFVLQNCIVLVQGSYE